MSDSTPTDHDAQSTTARRERLSSALAVGLLFTLAAIEPVAAQESVVCQAEKLPGFVEGFFRASTGIGVMGVVVIWQLNSAVEIFGMTPEQKKPLKQHKRAALKSGVMLAVLGPLYSVVGPMMGLPLAQCVDLAPW
jgi:hypothetical protein